MTRLPVVGQTTTTFVNISTPYTCAIIYIYIYLSYYIYCIYNTSSSSVLIENHHVDNALVSLEIFFLRVHISMKLVFHTDNYRTITPIYVSVGPVRLFF